MTDSSFPMSVPPGMFNGAVKFRPSANKTVLGVRFKKNSEFTFLEEDDAYVLVQGAFYYGVLRVRENYHFSKHATQVECWVDAKMIDHIKLTVTVGDKVEILELIRR